MARPQIPTKVLFIGNSFTYANNMPQMFQALADSSHTPVILAMHAPGGISVGDTIQGTMAHMNNPVVFQLIRSKKWDFVVIQDNQGRFVQDSAVFPAKSKVVQGHLNIMDSVKANNSCAKIILFGGWAWKYGMPPVGNTGIECIQRILCNYRVLNDTMKEVIAPIGEAWIKAFTYFPSVNLWDTDDAHPSYAGSYLTASVLFSTIFNLPATALNYNGAIAPADAYKLRCFADTAVFNPAFHSKYNLGAIKNISLQYAGGQLVVPGNFTQFAWYKNNIYLGNATSISTTGNGNYRAEVTENDGCRIKTCLYSETTTGLSKQNELGDALVFPNPVLSSDFITVITRYELLYAEIIRISGVKQRLILQREKGNFTVSTKDIEPGCYTLALTTEYGIVYKKIIVKD